MKGKRTNDALLGLILLLYRLIMNHNSLVLFTEPWNTQPANIAFHGSGCADLKQDPLRVLWLMVFYYFSAKVMFLFVYRTNFLINQVRLQ